MAGREKFTNFAFSFEKGFDNNIKSGFDYNNKIKKSISYGWLFRRGRQAAGCE